MKQPDAAMPEDSRPALSIKEIREWMDNAKQNNVEGLRSQFAAQPLLLDAAQSGIGNTAMHWAAARSSEQALQFLLEQKASTSVRNSSGCTPLHSAVRPRVPNPQPRETPQPARPGPS